MPGIFLPLIPDIEISVYIFRAWSRLRGLSRIDFGISTKCSIVFGTITGSTDFSVTRFPVISWLRMMWLLSIAGSPVTGVRISCDYMLFKFGRLTLFPAVATAAAFKISGLFSGTAWFTTGNSASKNYLRGTLLLMTYFERVNWRSP